MLGRIALILALLAAAPAAAQAYKPPRTATGQPDLEGDWTNVSFTRLIRPARFKGLTAPEAEAEAWLKEQRDRLVGIKPPPKPDDPPPDPDENDVGDIQSEAYEMDHVGLARIDGGLRTSWIVDPSDGRLPYNSLGLTMAEDAFVADLTDFRGPEMRHPDERCLVGYGSAAGPPMLNTSQNSHYRIVQTPTEIAILSEMIHDVRIVRLGAAHPKVRTHPWLGSSIGWWEGDTLVVETVDQHPGATRRIIAGGILLVTPAAKVTERFTRTSDTQIRYEFTVEDPAIYTRPWRAEMELSATQAPLYEYACHEGNYALPNILGGARQQEREAAAAKAKPK
jgi:hypothetical protein